MEVILLFFSLLGIILLGIGMLALAEFLVSLNGSIDKDN